MLLEEWSSSTIVWIELPAEPHDSLDWQREVERARKEIAQGKKIVWHFRLGLEAPFFSLEDSMRFQSLALSLKQFCEQIWPVFKETTAGFCLYRGSLDFEEHFLWSETQKENLASWMEEGEERASFCSEAFAIYFQMLSHKLPDEVPIVLLFEAELSARSLAILSNERFAHFTIGLHPEDFPRDGLVWNGNEVMFRKVGTSVGLLFPETLDEEKFDALLSCFRNKARVVFERFLTEEWEGLDQLMVMKDTLTPQGVRKLKGFSAAGGEIIYL